MPILSRIRCWHIARNAAPAVVNPYLGWTTGADADEDSDTVKERRRLWAMVCEPIVVPWIDGLKIRLYPDNDMSRIIYLTGRYEPNEFWWLQRFLRPGMTAIDVGANMGFYTLFLASRVGSGGRVLAIEPSGRDHQRLVDHLRLNKVTNVMVCNLALANADGDGSLKVAAERYSGHNTLGAYAYDTTEHAADEAVALRTLDGIVDDLGWTRIDFVKMDIEGAELAALEGATETLHRDRPALMIEVADRTLRHQGASAGALFEFLESRGYKMFRVGARERRLVPARCEPNHESENLFALHPGRSDLLDATTDK